MVSPPSSWFLRLLALLRLQPGERARFPCGEIPADVPDGRSAPVIRSGNTGESRFLGASLAVAVPIPFQDAGASRSKTGKSTPTFLQSERGGGVRPPDGSGAAHAHARLTALLWPEASSSKGEAEGTRSQRLPSLLIRCSGSRRTASEGVPLEPDWNEILPQLYCCSELSPVPTAG